MQRVQAIVLSLLVQGVLCAGCISSIEPPVAAPEGEILILGRGFGHGQGDGYVSFSQGAGEVELREVGMWSDRGIRCTLPEGVASSQVKVYADIPLLGLVASLPSYLVVKAPGLPSSPYGYEVPVQEDSPWPSFRHDRRNTGRSPIQARYNGDLPWSFETAKGIFSTPVIDGNGTVYVGSADRRFYAIGPDGVERWSFETGELIDSAAVLGRFDPDKGYATVAFLSGDGNVYCLRTDEGISNPHDRLLWTFQATVAPGPGYNNWWEGNVVMGFDGTLYAGNTNWNYYAINPEGTLTWTYTTGSNAWSAAAFADDGTIYWGSLDVFIHAVRPDGTLRWKTPTLGFVASSAAIGSEGTVYIGSFDSALYALDPRKGEVKWSVATKDHIYSSPALGTDEDGNTNAIYFGSADGTIYALSPEGVLLWTYDTGDTIRSSPAVGPGPVEEDRDVVYVGCGNGTLYAINADDGTRRWSFDTTPGDPELKDRNDLNGSPALGMQGVYIGGEHGFVWYVPYDYCLFAPDSRCDTSPGEAFGDNVVDLFYVTPGGTTEQEDPPTISSSAVITKRLVVREQGDTVDAAVCNNQVHCPDEVLDIGTWPAFPYRVELSADGHYIHMVPQGFLEPGTLYHLFFGGAYLTGGLRIGNLVIGGVRSGTFSDYMEVRTEDSAAPRIPLVVSPEEVTALEWRRLAAPLPPMLPSLNQIGFDSYHWILGTMDVTEPDAGGEGRFLMWAIGGRFNDEGILVADPATDFTFPLNGEYRKDFFILSNERLTLSITDVDLPFKIFELRGQLGADLAVKPGASAYAEAGCLSIPTFGPLMALAGLCNNVAEKLVAVGTYITRQYDVLGPANKRPDGISVKSLAYTPPTGAGDGSVVAVLQGEEGAPYPRSEHVGAILLVDTQELKAVSLGYHENLTSSADPLGNLSEIVLKVPAGTVIPPQLKAVVILDAFPLYQQVLSLAETRK